MQGEIPVGGNPDAILFEPFSDKVITCNGASKDLSIINPNTQKVVATVPLQARPETAVSDGKGRLFVNLEDKSRIAVVNMATFKVEKEWPLGKGEAPTGLAIDTVHHRLFAGCDNKLMIVLDEHDGRTIATLPIGDGCDGVALTPPVNWCLPPTEKATCPYTTRRQPTSISWWPTFPLPKAPKR